MKVTGLRYVEAASPVRRDAAKTPTPPGDGLCLLELLTGEALAGLAVIPHMARSAAARLVEDLLVGTDPRATTGSWQRMNEAAAQRRESELQAAIGALDIALWDLKAKLNGEPLWKTLGGTRPRANLHASDPQRSGDPQSVAAWATRMARHFGIHAAKISLSAESLADEDRVDALRGALAETGPATLAVDLGRSGASPKEAIRRVHALERRFDIAWLEGAAPDVDIPGLKQVSDNVRAAVSVGRRFGTTSQFLPHFEQRSADIIDIDIALTGITGALLLADAAYGYELPVTLAATHGNVGAHLAPVMPYFMSLEIVDPASASAFWRSDVRIEHGRAVAGDAHGHGLRAPAGESS